MHITYYISTMEAYKLFDFPHLIKSIQFNSCFSLTCPFHDLQIFIQPKRKNVYFLYHFLSIKYNLTKTSNFTETSPPGFIIVTLANSKHQNPQLNVKLNSQRRILTHHHSNITPFASLKAKQMD